MTDIDVRPSAWPALSYPQWRDTALTLQLWTQIVGKVRLALTPWLNHGWHVPLYVNARGLGTSAIHTESGILEIDFDLVAHRLVIRTAETADGGFALEPMSVAAFHQRCMQALAAAGHAVAIDPMPNEVPDPIRFNDDEVHASYDATAVHAFWQALVHVDRVFRLFRTGFLGKSSPVHLFWGSFDLAVTRFSGRPAPLHPGGIPSLPDAITRESYSHEVSSAGFWPGDERVPFPAFYSYAYPPPKGFAEVAVRPAEARFDPALGEFVLTYDDVRRSGDPAAILTEFLESTYAAAAELGGWDRRNLECLPGQPGRPRPL